MGLTKAQVKAMDKNTSFTPALPWVAMDTGDPECGTYVDKNDRECQGVLPDGWRDIVRRNDMALRCGEVHPTDTDGRLGSCGAKPGHEHPHIWIGNNWEILSVSRVEGICNECGHGRNAHAIKNTWRRCLIWKCECGG